MELETCENFCEKFDNHEQVYSEAMGSLSVSFMILLSYFIALADIGDSHF